MYQQYTYYNLVKKYTKLKKDVAIHDFFKIGFKLTDDDRFKEFKIEYSPWIITLCDWFEEPETEWIYLVQGSQTSKTTFMMGCLLYVAKFVSGPVPVFWCMHIEEEAYQFISNRLKPFLDEAGRDVTKQGRWKREYFRVFNASVKVGYASTKETMRSRPARFIFGDECARWKETTAYAKKRTRTFVGRRKGIFATTPPESGDHHSWTEATVGNFYDWHVPCPECGHFQALEFSNIVWDGRNNDGTWDYNIVRKTAKYRCSRCTKLIDEQHKIWMINNGKPVCVDPETGDVKKEIQSDTKTLRISSLYSVFTKWGQLAVEFLNAKAAGPAALSVFITDELAEVPKQYIDNFKILELSKYKKFRRKRGVADGYDLYTCGIDVQRLGELYFTVVGWKRGHYISGHILDWGVVRWLDNKGTPVWNDLIQRLSACINFISLAAVDSTDGVVTQDVYDFCNTFGRPFIPLRDTTTQGFKIQFKPISSEAGRQKIHLLKKYKIHTLLVINSDMIKDEIAAAFRRDPEDEYSWTFPEDIDNEYLEHLCNEARVVDPKRRGKYTWKPKYHNAPQHYFSSLVYATACMEEYRHALQTPLVVNKTEESNITKTQGTHTQTNTLIGGRRVRARASIW